MTERDYAIDVVRTLQSHGFQAVWAGGCVRDELLGLLPADYDVATDATPENVQKLFRRTIAIGASFGVIEVLGPKVNDEWLKVQVATFRRDGNYSDGRRPDTVTFSSAEEDARRRDFTVNGLFFDPIAKTLLDYVGGQADLNAKILRAIGDPAARFEEDKLRILRAVRMATRFDLSVEAETLRAGQRMAPQISAVSAERIAEELRKLLSHPRRADGLRLLRDFQLVEPILPETVADFESAIRTVEHLPASATFPLTLATVMRSTNLAIVKKISNRLRLSNDEKQRIDWLISIQSALLESLPRSRLYPILVHPGVDDLLAMQRAVAVVEGKPLAGIEIIEAILRTTPRAVLDPPPLITGDDLAARGWQPGPQFKTALNAVRAAQLDGFIDSVESAIELAEKRRQ